MMAWLQIPVRFQKTHVYIDHRGEGVTATAGGDRRPSVVIHAMCSSMFGPKMPIDIGGKATSARYWRLRDRKSVV